MPSCVKHSISFCINHHLLPAACSHSALSPSDFLTYERCINLFAACFGGNHLRTSNFRPLAYFCTWRHITMQHITPQHGDAFPPALSGAYCSCSPKWISNSVILAKLPFSLLQTSQSQRPFPLHYWLWLEVIALKDPGRMFMNIFPCAWSGFGCIYNGHLRNGFVWFFLSCFSPPIFICTLTFY